MVRKFILVYGTDSYNSFIFHCFSHLALGSDNIHPVMVGNSEINPAQVLRKVTNLLQELENKGFTDIVVLYSGFNTGLLAEKLPVKSIDLDTLVRLTTEKCKAISQTDDPHIIMRDVVDIVGST